MKKYLPLVLAYAAVSCFAIAASARATDPLPSWQEGATKAAIVDFVKAVTNETGADFVPVAQRIAVFDNDGTLWAEQPMYFQLAFAMHRVKAMAVEHPEWSKRQPFKAVLENDLKTLMVGGEHALLELMLATHTGMSSEQFTEQVTTWLASAKHPVSGRPYTEMVYQPMLELIDYLQGAQFKTYITSGGGIGFMRPWTEQVYGIPPEQVIGSSFKTEYVLVDGQPTIMRLPEVNFIDDKAGKPVAINHHIGRRPIAAFGNSDGDLPMLQWTCAGKGLRFCLYVHHTDEQREWAYDRQSAIGKLDQGLDEARDKNWTVVDMKQDWRRVFSEGGQ